jgi:hypothetical protein
MVHRQRMKQCDTRRVILSVNAEENFRSVRTRREIAVAVHDCPWRWQKFSLAAL